MLLHPPENGRMGTGFSSLWTTIQRRHWVATARRCGLGDAVENIIDELKESVPKAWYLAIEF